ncbi:unnamed protein product [marine sediment metagenome]|uniref:PsbP C-terminal domain-containing protein n=1 Tax=marine sediment metagenome TaxID=412755 RepID=X1LY48_9ZZZZ
MALLGAGVYLILHEEGVEWEKYSDEEYRFSFSYPPDWDLKHGNIPEELLGDTKRGVVVVASRGDLKAGVEAGEESLTLDELREKYLIMWGDFYLEIIEEENCEVSGVPAIRWRIADGGSHEVVIAVKGDMWYRLATVAPLDDYPGETFGRIMASFSIDG